MGGAAERHGDPRHFESEAPAGADFTRNPSQKPQENLELFDFELQSLLLSVSHSSLALGEELQLLNGIPETQRMLYFGHVPDRDA